MNGASIDPSARQAVYAAAGAGPLLQRDYIGVLRADISPQGLARFIRNRFVEIAPSETAAFDRKGGASGQLEVGDELAIRIGGVMRCRVRVVQVDESCLTLQTLCGHPEAGRISFKTGRDERGRPTLHIRSRARSGGLFHYLGYLLLGRAMQARCWIRFIGRAAALCGGELGGPVRVTTTRSRLEGADCRGPDRSTFDSEG